jgi:hypothetical protein
MPASDSTIDKGGDSPRYGALVEVKPLLLLARIYFEFSYKNFGDSSCHVD